MVEHKPMFITQFDHQSNQYYQYNQYQLNQYNRLSSSNRIGIIR